MTCPTRRVFLLRAAGAGGVWLALPGLCEAAGHVDENDDAAKALGYRNDSTQVDASHFPKHQAGQTCAGCSFFQGAPSDAWGGCAMFGRKQVAAGGWCNAWVKKPG